MTAGRGRQDMMGIRRNNRGFSLVELIIVIAIMTVMTGMVSVGTGLLSGRAARETRDKLLSSLESVRAQTMGKDEIQAELTYDASSGQYILKYTYNKTTVVSGTKTTTPIEESKVIGTDKCTIYYADSSFSDTVDTAADCESKLGSNKVAEGSSLKFSFDRSSGALKAETDASGAEYYIGHIYVVQGSHDPYSIRIYPETGKMMEE
jgi:prepilin-type N-terminal cleavage/methylation domain-containing protein